MPRALRLDQTPEVRHLEQPTSIFLSQIGVRGHVQVLQTAPLHLLVNVNCNEPSRQALERQLHNLYDIQEARGDQLMVVSCPSRFDWRDHRILALALWTLANALLALATAATVNHMVERWRKRPKKVRRWPARLFWLSPLLTGAAVLWAAAPPAALLLHLLLLLWWRRATQRTIAHGTQEAAIILMSLPPEHSAPIFKELGPETVHAITLEISRLPQVTPPLREAVLATFAECLRRASRQARLDKVEPQLFAAVLRKNYLRGPAKRSFQLGYHFARSLTWFTLIVAIVLPMGLSFPRPAPAPLQQDLQGLIAANPTAVATVVRDGQTRALVALGTDNLNAYRPLVAERAGQLGLNPLQVGCLGVNRHFYFPIRLLGGILLLGTGLLASWRFKPRPQKVAPPPPPPAPKVSCKPESVVTLMQIDEVGLEVGRGLLGLVDPNQGAKLLERVTSIRRQLAMELGYVLPGVRFRDNLALQRDEYVVRVRGVEVARGIIHPNHYLALLPEARLELEGECVLDPTFGQPAVWITPEHRARAEELGVILFDPVSVVASHLTKVMREHAAGVFTFNASLELLKNAQQDAVLSELEQRGIDRVALWRVLRDLLRQQVSIRDLTRILEGLLEMAEPDTDHEFLVEFARLAVRDRLVGELCASDISKTPQELVLWRVAPELLELLEQGPAGRVELLTKLTLVGERMRNAGHTAALLVTPEYRSRLQEVTLSLREMRVLSTAELPDWVQVRFFHGEGRL